MLTLYYSPGACSLASHITIEESGAPYEPQQMMLAKGEHLTPEYKKINPRQKVPALKLDDGTVITENTAILQYLGRSFPKANLLPKDGRARIMRFFAAMDERLGRSEFVAGPRYTIADITLLVAVDFAAWAKLKMPEGCAHLRRWYEAANARPSDEVLCCGM